MRVICPYCGENAILVSSRVVYRHYYGMIWICPPCESWIGVHKNSKSHKPIGRLANKELRDLKKMAHAEFDLLWKNGTMSRKEAYVYLQEIMNLPPYEAHIGRFTAEQCKRLIKLLKKEKNHGF